MPPWIELTGIRGVVVTILLEICQGRMGPDAAFHTWQVQVDGARGQGTDEDFTVGDSTTKHSEF